MLAVFTPRPLSLEEGGRRGTATPISAAFEGHSRQDGL